ncbi:hypothetical protein OE88DRAFT_1643004 [Heliocybe sulcata]|uniref:Uncharacterized protein n=1 Tax=Heliocybe sulcata TaxID=5364 RepID=A0A5C3NLM3_9AGAM|nr:hypothetical protein OE88DRAFT_1643004 [Heliocybe sulcata]
MVEIVMIRAGYWKFYGELISEGLVNAAPSVGASMSISLEDGMTFEQRDATYGEGEIRIRVPRRLEDASMGATAVPHDERTVVDDVGSGDHDERGGGGGRAAPQSIG